MLACWRDIGSSVTLDEELVSITREELVAVSFDSRDCISCRSTAKRGKNGETHVGNTNDSAYEGVFKRRQTFGSSFLCTRAIFMSSLRIGYVQSST